MNRPSSAVAASAALAVFVRRGRGAFALATLVALVACGGDDDAAQPAAGPGAAATVSAAPDSATVAWNAPAQIDVLANDTASSGTLSLTALGAPAHGSAAIVGGQLQYTPAAGYFGSDSIDYTAQTDDGGATASGTVSVTVEARLQLSGLVSDAPLAAAEVVVTVGAATFSTTADAGGQYRLNIAAAQPGDFIVVTATGTGAQAHVKLISLVGEAASLAAAADAAGEVSSTSVPALNATHWSTAQAVLAARTHGGLPTTAATLAAATSSVRATELLHLATLVRLVADGGVALPAGTTDTLALLQDSAALEAFSQSQVVGNAAAYAATQASVLADAPAVGPLGLAANGPRTLSYENAALVTYRSDGSASVLRSTGVGSEAAEATWSEVAGTVTLVYLTPLEDITYSNDIDPVSNIQNEIRLLQTGLVLRHVSGDRHAGTASLLTTGTATYVDGSRAGQALPLSELLGANSYLFNFTDLERRLNIDAAEVVAGSRWGGVEDPNGATHANSGDVMRILDATQATFERGGTAAEWRLDDRWLTVTSAGQRTRYARISVNPSTGEERWLSVLQVNGSDQRARTLMVMRADPGIRFDAAAMARRWRWEDWFADFPADPVVFNLFGDGTGSTDFGNVAPGSGQAYNWSVDGDGRIVMLSSNRERTITPLAQRNGQYFALVGSRSFDAQGNTTSVASTLVRRLADIGAAVKP